MMMVEIVMFAKKYKAKKHCAGQHSYPGDLI